MERLRTLSFSLIIVSMRSLDMDEFIILPYNTHLEVSVPYAESCTWIICIVGAPLVGALSVEWQIDRQDGAGRRPNDRAGRRPNDRAGTRPAPTASLGDVVGLFKSITTHQYAINAHKSKWPTFPGKLWQRNYYERIIRNDDEMNLIRQYIIDNPLQWNIDENNPVNIKQDQSAHT